MKCKVCGKEFDLLKERRYTVKSNSVFVGTQYYDAFDCPFCGCQNIAKEREMKAHIEVYEETEDDEKDDQEGV